MNSLWLAWKNIRYRALSSWISIVLFTFGVGITLMIFAVNKQIIGKFEKNLAGIDMILGAKGSPLQMVLCNMYHIDAPTGNIPVKEVTAFLKPGHPLVELAVPLSLGDNYQNFRIVGTDDRFLELYKLQIDDGESALDIYDVLIGPQVASTLGLSIGDTFYSGHGLQHDDGMAHDHGSPFTVSGILEQSNSVADQLIIATTASVWDVHHHDESSPHHDIDSFSILDHPDEEITSVLLRFKNNNTQTLNLLRNINDNTNLMAASPPIEVQRVFSLLGFGFDLIQLLGFGILFISGLSVFLSLLNSLKDRVKELALQKMLGSSRGYIFSQIVWEGALIGFFGSVLGIIVAWLLSEVVFSRLLDQYHYHFDFSGLSPQIGFAIGGCMVLGIISALYPAIKATRDAIGYSLVKR